MLHRPTRLALTVLGAVSITISASVVGEEMSTLNNGATRQAPDSRNQIVKLTDRGIEPPVLTTNKSDSIVFFLNATTDSLATIEIDYKDKRMHCASSALALGEDGKIRSVRPFGPRSFTSACFPDRGSYTVTVYGLNGKAERASGTIIVE